MGIPLISIISIVHLILIAMWGGVVATESVMEIYPLKKGEFNEAVINFHYWIDLLIELPVIIGVMISGITLFILTDKITALHIIKFSFVGIAISINLFCIYRVFQRSGFLKEGRSEEVSVIDRSIMKCGIFGIPAGCIAFVIGLWIAYHRVLSMISG